MTMTAEELGRLGEQTLGQWATQASITANPPRYDERGWDALLQFSAHAGGGVGPLDRLVPDFSCLIQVKTTMTGKSSEPITLSNLRRMATDMMPWFLLTLHVNDDHVVDGAHLIHIGEEWCSRVLRRLREIDPSEASRLHERTMNVSWGDGDALEKLHGSALKARLLAAITPDQARYVERKAGWFRDLGYESRLRTINLSVRSDDDEAFWRALAKVGTGVRKAFPGEWAATVSDVRFGIPAVLTKVDAASGDLEFSPPPLRSVTLHLSSGETEAPALECEVYRAGAVFPFIPPEYDEIRLVTPFVECVLAEATPGNGMPCAAHFTFSIPEALSLAELKTILPVLECVTRHAERPLNLRISADGHSVNLPPSGIGDIPSDFLELVATLSDVTAVCTFFGLPDEQMVIRGQVTSEREALRFMATMMRAARLEQVEELSGPYAEPIPIGEMYALLTESAIYLPDLALVIQAGAHGTVESCEPHPSGATIVKARGQVTVSCLVIDCSSDAAADLGDGLVDDARWAMVRRLRDLGCAHIWTTTTGPRAARQLTSNEEVPSEVVERQDP